MAHFRGGGQRQRKHWHDIPAVTLAFSSSATSAGGAFLTVDPFTVLRMLGEYLITPIGAPVVGDTARVCCAIGVVSGDASTAGAGSLPDPQDESDYPWLYWADHPLFFGNTSTDPSSQSASVRRTFDIRSMRKIKPREALQVVVQYGNISGDPPVQFVMGQTRFLVGE